ncbi:MAG: IS110 family transposase [Rhodobacteraceae bacterium]|nr:IS110 family transposase [Paracoccaceae bacterium]
MTSHTIGIDISKSRLDVFDLESGLATQFDNTISGLKSLRTWLGGRTITRIVFEPTGAYHKALEMRLGGDYPLVKVNPLQARRFAEAQGTKAKTDRTDARVLARMGQALDLRPQPPLPESQRVLKELHTARASLMTERIRLKCRFQQQDIPLLKRQTKALLAHVDRQIAELDVEVAALIGQQTEGQDKMNILTSIPGIGKLTASVILAFLPEIGGLDRKNVASLAGVAPMTRASGQSVGKAYIKGGRRQLRHALYMPALIATRFNPDLKAKYDQLRGAGKPAKVAIVAVMRKLVELANALVKAGRKWEPRRHAQSA